jgi:hypothetical protein
MLNDEWLDLIISLTDTNLEIGALGTYLPNPLTDIMDVAFLEKARVSFRRRPGNVESNQLC